MNWTYVLLSVAVMALVTYLPRMLPLVVFRKRIQNRFVRSFLAYVPYAVLSAMTFPAILYSTSASETVTAANMACAGAGLLVALALAYKNKGLLIVALGAAGTAFITDQIFRLIQTGGFGLF